MKKTAAIILAIALSLVALASCGKGAGQLDIGGYKIDADLAKYITDNGSTPEICVSVYALADAEGYDHSGDTFKSKCDAEYERILAEGYGGDEDALEAELEEYGIEGFFDKIVEQGVLRDELYGYLAEKGKIESDKDSIRKRLLDGEAVRVKRIIVDSADKTQLDEGYDEYISGKISFEDLADSLAKYSVEKGIGDYEDSYVVVKGNSDVDYENACFALEADECSEPFSTSAGYCLVKRYELTDGIVDKLLDRLAVSYMEGQYNLMLEAAAETLK